MIYFFPDCEVFSGPNKSMWILWLGIVHCGSGDTKFVVALLSFFVFWHLSHWRRCSLMCWSIPGHQYDCRILSFVLNCPSWPYITLPCSSIAWVFLFPDLVRLCREMHAGWPRVIRTVLSSKGECAVLPYLWWKCMALASLFFPSRFGERVNIALFSNIDTYKRWVCVPPSLCLSCLLLFTSVCLFSLFQSAMYLRFCLNENSVFLMFVMYLEGSCGRVKIWTELV